ncbi:xanthine dehydrogenase family protein molybdopterin-binding subunit [Alicyclobacillus tolerans]|uniref:xanthine dehydrogenase family protein molybdopterin-binding subunit n=1 Tax=Alicyclobacillus tolerans TaxID=90970 RepID=UPI001F1BE1D3|nr:xanthine dehydrogenase family protein molybdopterin-binding subunit [Alicyclobacillus tolerans]MCF8565050.1 xanthine dehydrogenase family protein molybdopterin-binding subunit [Alicyclobacillus tolerans]
MSEKTLETARKVQPFAVIGQRMPRKEDYRLLTGTAQFVDDIEIPRALHACFVRSPHAHAKIVNIDTSKALEVPGVVFVATGKDLAQWTAPARMAPPIEGLQAMEMTTLPIDKVRFDGDPVACVVAVDRYTAEDAAELVEVRYEPLPAVTNMFDAVQEDAPLVDEALVNNLVSHQTYQHGDVRARFEQADRVVEAQFSQHRQTHVPMETRGCAAVWDPGRQYLTFYTGTQVPHPMRTTLAARLGLKETQVNVVCPDIGGAFGQKIALYREELTVAALARVLKRPVRWREDRMENLLAATQAREDFVKTRTAVTKDGRILGMEAELFSDFGAYSFFPANYMIRVVAMLLPGPYKIQDYAFEMKVALTNKCPAGPMRAPMAITSWITEGTMDEIARQLGLDPIEVRKVNMLRPEDLPYESATGELYEDITPMETLEAAVEHFGYAERRKAQMEGRKQGKYRGIGICSVLESTTYGSEFYRKAGIPGTGHEAAWVRIEPTGVVNASCGIMGSGQGYETTVAQAVAEGLGCKPEDVAIHLGDTLRAPYGMGSRGSRGAVAGAGTAYLAAQKAQAKVLQIAAKLLGIGGTDGLSLQGGNIMRRAGDEWLQTDLTLKDIAQTAYLNPLLLPEGMEPGIEVVAAYDPPAMTYSNAAHVCEVEVEVETGKIDILRYVIVEDAGTMLNPQIVEGQVQGATAMGIGGVLFEQVVYDENGQNLTGSLMDYLLPTACEVPNIEVLHMQTPNHRTPAGIKGMSEGGVMGAIGALSNAVSDALQPFGITIVKQPLTPSYIRKLLRDAGH